MNASDLAKSRIGQIATVVHDLGSAIAFYRDTLGLPLLFEAPPKMAFFDCGGVRLMLSQPEEPRFDHPGSVLYFKVDDIHATHRTLADRGVRFEREPHLVAKMATYDLWMGFFTDLDDNILALMSEVARA